VGHSCDASLQSFPPLLPSPPSPPPPPPPPSPPPPFAPGTFRPCRPEPSQRRHPDASA
jgi:hypothetical protein